LSEQRYEPLPGLDQLPAWLWRRTGPKSRIAIGAAILRARCEPFPKTVNELLPERDPRRASGSYACVAVTSVIDRSAAGAGGELGHPYRASLDFTTGRYALCKVAGRPDPVPDPEVTTPQPCAGGRLPAP
jgi:hypothetical protein